MEFSFHHFVVCLAHCSLPLVKVVDLWSYESLEWELGGTVSQVQNNIDSHRLFQT